MKHEEAVQWIVALERGDLDGEIAGPVARHRERCAECTRLLDTYRRLVADLDPGDPVVHPPASLITSYALGTPEIGSDLTQRIGTHLRDCPDCRGEVETIRDAERRLSTGESPRWAWRVAAVAAGLLLVVTAYALHLRLVRIPALASSSVVTGDWSGAVRLPILGSTLRAGQEREVVCVRAAQPSVPMLAGPMPLSISQHQGLRFEISARDGRITWTADVDAALVEDLVADSELVPLLVPAAAVPPGEYRLVVRSDHGNILDAPFVVERCSN